MPIIEIDPHTGERVAFTPGRNARMPQTKTKKPWSKQRDARFKNHTVKFGHLDAKMSGRQISAIAALASKAFKQLKVQGWTLEEWRQDECVKTVGCRLSQAPGKFYPRLKSHFEFLCGNIDQGLKWEARSSDTAQRSMALMHLIRQELCKLPRLSADDTEEPAKGTPRKTAWAWADVIAMRKFGAALATLERDGKSNALGTLHALIKHEVSNERKLEKMLNKQNREVRKQAKAAGIKMPRVKAVKPLKPKAQKPDLAPCKKCGDTHPVCNDGSFASVMPVIQCPACNFMIEGNDFGDVLVAWNKGRAQ